jgi:hypothetical protein
MANKIILILALFMLGCNPIKKAERTVLNNLESSERVFRELEKTRPCANDTTIITKYDTTLLVDTFTNYQRDTITINDKEYITIKEAGKTIVKTIKVNQIHTGYIVDTRRVGILLDSVRYLGTSLKDSNKTSNKWMWRFWGLLGILIGYIIIKRFLWSYLNILH